MSKSEPTNSGSRSRVSLASLVFMRLLLLQCRHEDLLQCEGFRRQRLRGEGLELFQDFLRMAVDGELQLTALAPDMPGLGKLDRRRCGSKARANLLVAGPCIVRSQRQCLAAVVDDGELVDEPLELADQVRGDKHRAIAWIGFLVGSNHRLNELAADDRIEAGGRLVQHKQIRSGERRVGKEGRSRWVPGGVKEA